MAELSCWCSIITSYPHLSSQAPHTYHNELPTPLMCAGKLNCLSHLLASIVAAKQRCVLVSTSTAALDLIDEVICQAAGYSTVRIDGSTNVNERQGIVDSFNAYGRGQVWAGRKNGDTPLLAWIMWLPV